MKKSMTFEVLPHGPCTACLEAMIDPERGKPAFHQDLGAECSLWAIYCEHVSAGAYAFVGPSASVQWSILAPVELPDFLALVDRTAGYYRAAKKSSISH